jgi:ABC-2 type transport system permease protein
MTAVGLIVSRELKAYVRSWIAYAAAAGVLLIDGVWFMAKALSGQAESKLSAAVLAEFFMGASGTTAILAVALSMRLIAAEHDSGTLVLLKTSPIRDWEVVLGKFLSAVVVLFVVTALTAYMPLLLLKAGKISWGHVGVGYVGIFLLGVAVTAIGLFASAWAKNQVVAAIAAAVMVGLMYLWWLVAKIADPPVNGFLEGLAIHHLRMKDFMTGTLRLENVVFYLAVSFFFLLASVKTLEARRWR